MGLRGVLLVGLLLLGGCSGPEDGPLPAIVMTGGGGFEGGSQRWTISPGGAWIWERDFEEWRSGPRPTPRTGRLTGAAARELAAVANDPDLVREMRRPHERCSSSDGSYEYLEVGSNDYLAGWCDENRPHIDRLRARIAALMPN